MTRVLPSRAGPPEVSVEVGPRPCGAGLFQLLVSGRGLLRVPRAVHPGVADKLPGIAQGPSVGPGGSLAAYARRTALSALHRKEGKHGSDRDQTRLGPPHDAAGNG